MTKEDKELLLKDLCARLPYGVMIQRDNCFGGKVTEKLNAHGLADNEVYGTFESLNYKPFLRPMSSMTNDEKREYIPVGRSMSPDNPNALVDWLNKHHFDYRGLIDKGLAIEAPEGMYKNE